MMGIDKFSPLIRGILQFLFTFIVDRGIFIEMIVFL